MEQRVCKKQLIETFVGLGEMKKIQKVAVQTVEFCSGSKNQFVLKSLRIHTNHYYIKRKQ